MRLRHTTERRSALWAKGGRGIGFALTLLVAFALALPGALALAQSAASWAD